MPKYTVIELSDRDAKVLQVSKTRKTDMVLETAFAVDFSDLGADEEGSIQRGVRLRDALKKHKVPPGPCSLIIPKQNAIVRTAQLPSGDIDELKEMARFEGEKYIPFNTERHIISNAVLHLDAVEGSHMLIAAVDGPVMEKALAILREAKMEPEVAEVSSISLVRAFSHFEHEALEQPAMLLLNLGQNQADFAILKDGMLVSARSTSLGVDQLNQSIERAASTTEDPLEAQELAESTIRTWINRIVRFGAQTYDFASREYGIASTSCLYISGEGATLQGLDTALSKSLGIEVHYFNPISKIKHAGNGQIEKDSLPGMTNALGAALRMVEEGEGSRAHGERINLLPPEVIEQQKAAERKVLLMISGVMVIITLILLYLAFDTQRRHSEMLRERYTEYNREMKPTIDDQKTKLEQLDIIEQITSNRASVLEILNQITLFPGLGSTADGGVLTIEEFKYTVRNEVTISGTAISLEDMQQFADYLERMNDKGRPIFEKVGLPQPKPVALSHNRGNVYTFSISCVLNEFETGE